MAAHRVAYYIDPGFFCHDPGYGHPERAARLGAIEKAVERDRFDDTDLIRRPARPAERRDLLRVHDESYLRAIDGLCCDGGGSLDPDTSVSEASFAAATLAAGAGIDAAERIRSGEFRSAFVAARPPGHHARPRVAMGFCIVNNVAVVAAKLAEQGDRVAILDWDAHHGNGTQEVFWRDPRVLYVSTHQYPWYPFTGTADEVGDGEGAGTTLNIPMPAGAGPDDYLYAFDHAVLPAIHDFRPDWLLVSAGFDAHRDDPLCDLHLTAETYRRLAADAADVGVPMIGFLEGGYALEALGASVRATLEAWVGDDGGSRPGGGGVHARVVSAVGAALAARRAASPPR